MYFVDFSKLSIFDWLWTSGGRTQLSGGWAHQELSLDGHPLQSLSLHRGQVGAILVDIDDDDDRKSVGFTAPAGGLSRNQA